MNTILARIVAPGGSGALGSTLAALVALSLSFGAAFIGSRFGVGAWYATLAKPGWTPPNWLFGPVWSLLYLMMAVASWLVWKRAGLAGAALPLAVFVLQLFLNAAWSWLFFGRHAIGLALLDIVLLWIAIAGTIVLFRGVDRRAGMLLVPYLLWVTYAAALNARIWQLNR